MKKIKIVADSKIPFLTGALEKNAKVKYIPGNRISNNHLHNADGLIIRTRTFCDEELLRGTPVKFIASATTGYSHIDVEYCDANNVKWKNAAGCNSGAVKQYIASALANIISYEKRPFEDITLGIIGVGNIGSKVESLARALGIKTLLNDPPRQRSEESSKFTNINHLISQSDIITMHVPLNNRGEDKTFHMADKAFFSNIKKNAWFINTSRGEVVQTSALLHAIQKKQITGAVIDVWENEPYINAELVDSAFISTPHIAGYSIDGKANGTAMSIRAISKFFNFGMDNWYPDFILSPNNPQIEIYNILDPEDFFCKLSLHTYDIMADSQKLKRSPDTFEIQRDTYPPRREEHAFKVKTKIQNNRHQNIINNLGFKTEPG